MHAARAAYSRSLEVRDRIAGAGATTTAAGLAMGAPVMAAVKSYASMEDAMKGVAKQVSQQSAVYPAGTGKNGERQAAAGYHHHAQSR